MVCYEYSWQVSIPCWSQIIASVRGSIQRLMIHEREVIYVVLGKNLIAGNDTISIINLSHMCAYSAILRLESISNKSIEAIELSKIPRDIWARVAPQSLDTDMQRLFYSTWFSSYMQCLFYSMWPPSFSFYIFLIGKESGGGHRIKRALYIGIKRLCFTGNLLAPSEEKKLLCSFLI